MAGDPMTASARQWIHLTVVVALALGIAALVQSIAERHSIRWDLSQTRAFSLSEATQKVLATTPGRIDVTLFYQKDDYPKALELMELFKGADAAFHYELLDLDRHPGRAREEGVEGYAKAVIRYRGDKVVVEARREQDVAAALLRLSRGRPTVVRFLEGHGERAVNDATQPTGYGELRQELGQENYAVGGLSLLDAADVPADTDLVVVAGPKSDLLDVEIAALDRYLDRGGHVLVLVDPVPLRNLERFIARRGIEASLDVVVDGSNRIMGSDPFTIRVPTYRSHPITSSSSTPALLAVVRSVDADAAAPGVHAAVLAETYPDAWAFRDLERAGKQPPREGEDRRGPVPVAAASSWTSSAGFESRLVVIGDSDFAANSFIGLLGNRDLVLDSIGWLVSPEAPLPSHPVSEISAAKPISPLVLSDRSGKLLFVLVVVIEPALVLAFGSAVAMQKRWRG